MTRRGEGKARTLIGDDVSQTNYEQLITEALAEVDGCDDGRHCDRHGNGGGDGDVMMSIMIGRNNSALRGKRGLPEGTKAIRPTIKNREFPRVWEWRIRELEGIRLYASISIFAAYTLDFSCA
jgi:hypothetical protein